MADITTDLVSSWLQNSNALTDHGSAGNDLTNSGPVPFEANHASVADAAGTFSAANANHLVKASPSASVPLAAPWTLACWIKPASWTSTRAFFGVSDGTSHWYAGVFSSRRIGVSLKNSGGGAELLTHTTTVGEMPFDEWAHLTLVVSQSGSTVTLTTYINGVLAGTDSHANGMTAAPPTTPPIYIGSFNDGSSVSFAGALSDIRLYSRVFTADDAAALAAWPINFNDQSGNGNDATAQNFPATIPTTAGPLGEDVAVFDGTDDYLTTTVDTTGWTEITVVGWCKSSYSASNQTIVGGDGTGEILLRLATTGHLKLYPSVGSPSREVTSDIDLNDGDWHSFGVAYEGGVDLDVVVDGLDQSAGSLTSDIGDGEIRIGRWTGEPWNGSLAYLAIFDTKLSVVQMQALHAAATPAAYKALAISYGAVGYWSMSDDSAAYTGEATGGLRGRRTLSGRLGVGGIVRSAVIGPVY